MFLLPQTESLDMFKPRNESDMVFWDVVKRKSIRNAKGCFHFPGKPNARGDRTMKFRHHINFPVQRAVYIMLVRELQKNELVKQRCEDRTCNDPRCLYVVGMAETNYNKVTAAREDYAEMRFADLIENATRTPSGCLEVAGKSEQIGFRNKLVMVSRFAYEQHNKCVLGDDDVVHVTCHNRLCAEKTHLLRECDFKTTSVVNGKEIHLTGYNAMRWLDYVSKATKDGDCLLWNGACDEAGYGRTKFGDRVLSIHQISFIIHFGEVSEGMVVRHKCPKMYKHCFAPCHVEEGTHEQNSHDRFRDGTVPFGETHRLATMTNEEALQIANSKGIGTQQERADRFGKTKATVAALDVGATFSRVTGIQPKKKRKVSPWKPKREDYENAIRLLTSRTTVNEDGCFLTDFPKRTGYGTMSFCGRTVGIHIISWEYYHNNCEKVPEGKVVRHYKGHNKGCNRGCWNKEHVLIGTHAENAHDRDAENVNSQRALEIRNSIGQGTKKERADRFNVSLATISLIDSGKIWKWVGKEAEEEDEQEGEAEDEEEDEEKDQEEEEEDEEEDEEKEEAEENSK